MNTQRLPPVQAIGAELNVSSGGPTTGSRHPSSSRYTQDFTLDIAEQKGRESILCSYNGGSHTLEMLAVDVEPDLRHLLLLAKPLDRHAEKRKFLCGHDERHWFVAAIPRLSMWQQSRCNGILSLLQPSLTTANRVKQRVNARHNAGYLRQGNGSFCPCRILLHLILPQLQDEPIRRGPETSPGRTSLSLRRTRVYVHHTYPNGLTEKEYMA